MSKWPPEYFWSKVAKGDEKECWEWKGYKDPNGYGRYGRIPAHRVAFKLMFYDPGKLCVCHKCDNPPCCNPCHLWVGTQLDNIADMNRKKRGKIIIRYGENVNTAKLTSGQALYIFCSNETGPTLGKRFGVSKEAINNIKKGKSWKHITHGETP